MGLLSRCQHRAGGGSVCCPPEPLACCHVGNDDIVAVGASDIMKLLHLFIRRDVLDVKTGCYCV